MKDNVKRLLIAALIRALRTFLQTLGGGIVVGAAFSDIQWLHLVSVAGVAAIASLLMSLGGGLPEASMNKESEENSNDKR